MTKLIFRDLRADEIDCRVATISEKGLSLLLYKDARCDMNILDETVGPFNWQRTHSRENANCTVSIWDEDKKQWISKEDTGTESNTEAAKGLASDSFKRACFNWGIGRELYTAPNIWIKADACEIKKNDKGKWNTYDKFCVKEITITDKKITGLAIYSISRKQIVYTYGKTESKAEKQAPVATSKPQQEEPKTTQQQQNQPKDTPHRLELRKYMADNGFTDEQKAEVAKECGLGPKSTDQDYEIALMYARTILLTGGVG